MIVFDHNIPRHQVTALRRSRIRGVQVGFEVGRPEWLDQQEVARFLHRSKNATFITRDAGSSASVRSRKSNGDAELVVSDGVPLTPDCPIAIDNATVLPTLEHRPNRLYVPKFPALAQDDVAPLAAFLRALNEDYD